MWCPNHQYPGCPHYGKGEVEIVDNGKSVKDADGVQHVFHDKCYIDVITGWSGSIMGYEEGESFEQASYRCYKQNFGMVGIVLPDRSVRGKEMK